MDDATATWQPTEAHAGDTSRTLALVLLAFPSDPDRVGQVALLPQGEHTLGRHGTLAWVQQRPGLSPNGAGPLSDQHLSREQVRLTVAATGCELLNLGRLPLYVNGRPVSSSSVRAGDIVQIADRVLLWVTTRPETLPGVVAPRHRFGEADPQGILGESEAAWALRERLAFLGRRDQHVLVLGESGTGKELVAQALHALSPRAGRVLVSRNAATIPESLADAELFGNIAGYPNQGMPGRPGLVGEAHQSSLFLDEFGELPVEQQARLLRVMDSGEYTSLGDARPRVSDLRLIAATNRDPSELKHDVLARFVIRVSTPPLSARREDVPLLAAHLLRNIAASDSEIEQRFFEGRHPRLDLELVRRLVVHPYTTHVRELQALLWQSITGSPAHRLVVPEGDFLVQAPDLSPQESPGHADPAMLDPETIQAAIDRNGGRQDPTWRELGLSSRHVLARLVKKYDLQIRGRGGS